MGFAAGVKAGTSLVDSILQEKRASEEFGWKRTDRERADQQRADEDVVLNRIRARTQGLETPEAVAAASAAGAGGPEADTAQGATGVRAGTAAGFATEPVGSPQPVVPAGPAGASAAITGTATAPTPAVQATPQAGPQTGLPMQQTGAAPAAAPPQAAVPPKPQGRKLGRDVLDARDAQELALAKRDIAGYNAAKVQEDAANINDIVTRGMQVKDADMDTSLSHLNTNLSNYPLLLTEKGKGGYEFTKLDTSGNPDGKIKLTGPQARQVMIAGMLSEAGYGQQAYERLNGVSKELGETYKVYNEAQNKATTANNQATKNANSDEQDRARTGIAAGHLALAREKDAREQKGKNEVFSASEKGTTTFNQTTGKFDFQPWPEGTPQDVRDTAVKKFRTQYEPKVSADGQTMTMGPKVFAANPNYGADPKKVGIDKNVTDQWLETTPGAQSDIAKSVAAAVAAKKAGEGGGAAPAKPKEGLSTAPAQPGFWQRLENSAAASYDADRARAQQEKAGQLAIQQAPADELRAVIQQGYGQSGENTARMRAAINELQRRGEAMR